MDTRRLMLTTGLIGCTLTQANATGVEIEPASRIRYQMINDKALGDATASTLKFRLNSDIEFNESFFGFAQFDLVHAFDEESYNSINVTRDTSPISDVEGHEINQLWMSYETDLGLSFKVGRQLINHDAQRHISSVEFWQNDQSFDSFTVSYNNETNFKFTYSFVSKVHRIFGDTATHQLSPDDIRFSELESRPVFELGNHDHNSHLLNLNYKHNNYVTLSSYALLLDNKSAPQFSSDTYGIRLNGEFKPNNIRFIYELEAAYQSTTEKSPWRYSGYFYRFEFGAQYKSHRISLGSEVLSEDNGFAFATSLGDNHRYLGWADIFNAYANADGIIHDKITYRGRSGKLRWRAIYNDFSSYSTDIKAGEEYDFELAYRFNRELEASLIAAFYKADAGIEGITASQSDLSTLTFSLKYNL